MTTDATAQPHAGAAPRLYLIRHGQTAWSLSGQHTSRTDLSLTPIGREEASALASRLRGVAFTRIFSSPRQRAIQTAELAGLTANVEIEPDLVEWDYGDFEGKRASEIEQLQPGWNIYRDGCPNGESASQIGERADRLIARLRTLSGNIALVSHGHFGRVLAVRWIGLPVAAASHLMIDTASLGILTFNPGRGVPAIALWNSTGKS